jgi:hypothetical protein
MTKRADIAKTIVQNTPIVEWSSASSTKGTTLILIQKAQISYQGHVELVIKARRGGVNLPISNPIIIVIPDNIDDITIYDKSLNATTVAHPIKQPLKHLKQNIELLVDQY